ncbi:prepilin peptidase [Pelagicoccus enzymogenes]|uniref:preprotein translocase subunit SecA n=1 Tax=Pelagicoccus enzymogenes TaxID=2773457 RepID=UPI00280EFE1F|nr:prepilin peptidase [Pelagicoccus enzymogenes]MDQ8198764.1 prepilin peptidase [Pelagicoccus enzymogenes]
MSNPFQLQAPSEFQHRFYEKPVPAPLKGMDVWAKGVAGRWSRRASVRKKWQEKVDTALGLLADLRDLSDEALDSELQRCGAAARLEGPLCLKPTAESLALVCELSRRSLGLTPYPVQMLAALALCQGYLAEIDTGEGKTLSLAMAASLACMGGGYCHIVTANDYLADRDAKIMSRLYDRVGLEVGSVTSQSEPVERSHAYAKQVVYTTAKEVAADYLRDRIFLGEANCSGRRYSAKRLSGRGRNYVGMVQRGLFRAFIDEADNGLIDEATTPLIISRQQDMDDLEAACRAAWFVASEMEEGRDFRVWVQQRRLEFTPQGRQRARESGSYPDAALWECPTRRSQLVQLGLEARQFFLKGTHYIIEKKYLGTSTSPIVIVDESTGRPMPNRSWKLGMHQMVEAKEDLPMTPPTQTIAQISFQTFFRRYGHLSGATGTAKEIADEVWQTYDLATVRIPRNKPKRVSDRGMRFFLTVDDKEDAIIEEIRQRQSNGQPVLVGTQSVTASERLARRLNINGVRCEVLNAVRIEDEAKIIEQAGQLGHVTIATNMAGRGTDIKLKAGVEALGGLHVIATEPASSRRVHRQLFGRAARQGARGSTSAYYSFEDELLVKQLPSSALRVLKWFNRVPLVSGLSRLGLFYAQRRAEKLAKIARKAVMKNENELRSSLGFSRGESTQ